MVTVINYGVGNINSVCNMIRKVQGEVRVIDNPKQLMDSKKIILPGVGAFDHGMNCLKDGGWLQPLNEMVLQKQIPVLGICLGMQLMCNSSEEGQLSGLGWIDASVKKFSFDRVEKLQVPHMGWNFVEAVNENKLLPKDEKNRRFYFVHSYYVECKNSLDVLLVANYGRKFVAGFKKGNIYGVQFHPEKSHKFGMELMANFVGLAC